MRIVIDDSIPFIRDVFEPFAEVAYVKGLEMSAADVRDADAIIIRSRTKCGAALLDGSAVKVIATTNIGIDNIDLDYCSSHGIFVRNASGCNAGGVANYVFSALYGVAARKAIRLDGATIGIIGVGNVGRRVESMANILGFNVLRYDPPRAENEGAYDFCTLDYLLMNSNIVTFHSPLNDATRGMANEAFFSKMRPGTIFINASRGEIMDDEALKAAASKLGAIVIDTWNNEPYIDEELLDIADIATPHIAGYSYQGKLNGTASAVRTVARYFDIKELMDFYPKSEIAELNSVKLDIREKSQGEIASLFQYNYPIFTDDFLLRVNPSDFLKLRKDYRYRKEFYIE